MPESLSLAVAYVDFVARGVDTVFKSIDDTKKKVGDVHAAGGGGAGGGGGGGDMAEAGAAAGGTAAGILLLASAAKSAAGALLGFIQAGLSQTGQMAVLNFQMEILSRTVAAIFLPVLDLLISVVETLNSVLESVAGVADHFLDVIVRVAGKMFDALLPGLDALADIFVELLTMIEPVVEIMGGALVQDIQILSSVLKVLAQAALGVTAMFNVLMKVGLKGLFDPKSFGEQLLREIIALQGGSLRGGPHRRIEMAPGAFLSPEEFFKKIQQAVSGGGKTKEEEIADNTKRTADALEKANEKEAVNDVIKHLPPKVENGGGDF